MIAKGCRDEPEFVSTRSLTSWNKTYRYTHFECF